MELGNEATRQHDPAVLPPFPFPDRDLHEVEVVGDTLILEV
jgi:hypothetical protein